MPEFLEEIMDMPEEAGQEPVEEETSEPVEASEEFTSETEEVPAEPQEAMAAQPAITQEYLDNVIRQRDEHYRQQFDQFQRQHQQEIARMKMLQKQQQQEASKLQAQRDKPAFLSRKEWLDKGLDYDFYDQLKSLGEEPLKRIEQIEQRWEQRAREEREKENAARLTNHVTNATEQAVIANPVFQDPKLRSILESAVFHEAHRVGFEGTFNMDINAIAKGIANAITTQARVKTAQAKKIVQKEKPVVTKGSPTKSNKKDILEGVSQDDFFKNM